jgi:hypothetical protein
MGHAELPFRVKAYYLDLEQAQVGILLVSYFEPSNPGDQARLEGQVVLGLRLRVNVLNDDVDRLAWVGLVEVDRPDEVVVLEDLRRRKGAREQLLGLQRLGVVELGGREARDSRQTARKQI